MAQTPLGWFINPLLKKSIILNVMFVIIPLLTHAILLLERFVGVHIVIVMHCVMMSYVKHVLKKVLLLMTARRLMVNLK
jgi:hypothetical protein